MLHAEKLVQRSIIEHLRDTGVAPELTDKNEGKSYTAILYSRNKTYGHMTAVLLKENETDKLFTAFGGYITAF